MANSVFILGAGASKQAGVPLMAEFLDVAHDLLQGEQAGKDAESYRVVFNALSALQAVHSKAQLDIQNVESVFAAFEMANTINALSTYGIETPQQISEAMKAVMVATIQRTMALPISSGQPTPPQPYEAFVEFLSRLRDGTPAQHTVAVISFNYDLGLDYTFYYKHIPIWYAVRGTRHPRAFPLLKLHGSLNWAYCSQCHEVIPWQLENYFSNRRWSLWPDTKSATLTVGSNIALFKDHEHPVDQYPFIVPPTWNKTVHYATLSPVWAAAAAELRDAENIVIVGYSLPESDYFFRFMYALSTAGPIPLKRFWVFDPDPSGTIRDRYRALLGPGASKRFQYFEMPFNKAIGKLYQEFQVTAAA